MLFCSAAIDSCDSTPISQQIQNTQQERLNQEAVRQAGLPNIIHFREKKILKRIFEDRDKELPTITYVQDLNGHLHKFCDSVGYPISAATEYTSPGVVVWGGNGGVLTPQEDPNGLFSAAVAEGSWVMCQNPTNPEDVRAVYSEPRLIGSPFPLDNVVK